MIDIIAIVLLAFGCITLLTVPASFNKTLGEVAMWALLAGTLLVAVGALL